MCYNCKFSQKNRLQINYSNHSTNHLVRKITTKNPETDSFAKPHKKWTSWIRAVYRHFCDLMTISDKRKCIQRHMENKQFTLDFSSSILMNSGKCFTKGFTWQITLKKYNFEQNPVLLFLWFQSSVTEMQIDANLYQKPTDYKKVLLNYFREFKKLVYKWLPPHSYATNEWFEKPKCSATYHSWTKEFTNRYQYAIMLQLNDFKEWNVQLFIRATKNTFNMPIHK